MVAPLSAAVIYQIMDHNPAASLRASAKSFEAIGLKRDAEFTLGMAEAAEICPPLYHHWAREQAKRVQVKMKEMAS
jgi:hypothetical protein